MAVVEEWLSSTEPGLQIDSPTFPFAYLLIKSKKIFVLTKYFNFVGHLCVR